MAKKPWSYKAGEKGRNRVRAFEVPGGIFLEYYEQPLGSPEPKRKRVSTGHRDRQKAKLQADELAAAFGREEPPPSEGLTLKELFDSYLVEVTPYKGSESKRSHDRRCAEIFLDFLGANRKPSTLSRRDWDRFIHGRRSGEIRPRNKPKKPVGNRTIAYDLTWIQSVLNWAALAGDGRGGFLLEKNPLKGLTRPREDNPQSHKLESSRLQAMLKVGEQVSPHFNLALILAYETGRRIGSIRQLQWSDVDWKERRIRWRAETDKQGRETYTPLSDRALQELAKVRKNHPAIGDTWVLPSPTDPEKPCSRNLVRDWWYRAEDAAGLEHLPRTAWHGFRRTFVTDLANDGQSLATIAALGGWREPQTILRHYLKTDEATMRGALARRNRAVG
jgi:integrase